MRELIKKITKKSLAKPCFGFKKACAIIHSGKIAG